MSSESEHNFVVVASRLPVDRVEEADGGTTWRTSPGGLVTALEPVMREAGGVWIGWSGDAGPAPGAFEADGLHLVGLGLSDTEVTHFYEGFCNATLWPLYHDVIAPPQFHRRWWEAYVTVNRRFAQAAAEQAAPGATVWVHDYQLQLVPRMLREQRDDVRIGFFNHIPFPGYEIFAHQSYPREEMAALYLAGDVMLVTPLRDGMNLVAKEYVACRNDENGTLVLSEFTGAADELAGAFLVNPHDIEGLKDTIVRAANASPADARRRMRAMRKRAREHDVARWAASFLDTLGGATGGVAGDQPAWEPEAR